MRPFFVDMPVTIGHCNDFRANRLHQSIILYIAFKIRQTDDCTNHTKGSEHIGALLLGVNRCAMLLFFNKSIRFKRNEEQIAGSPCFFEKANVPKMQDIKTSANEHNPLVLDGIYI